MYAQATIHTVVKTSVESGTHAVRLLGAFEKIYAPIFAALHEFLLELGGGRMLTPEELAPILDRWRGELPIDGPPRGRAVARADGAGEEASGRPQRVLSNLQRLLNSKDLQGVNGGGARRGPPAARWRRGGGAVSSGGGVERAFGGAKKVVKKVVKRVAEKAGACVPRRRSRSRSPATRSTRLRGGMVSAVDDDPSCKEMVAGGRTNPRTGVPSALKANSTQCMNQQALKQLKIG